MSANESTRPAATVTLHHVTGTVSEYEFRSVKMATSFAVKAAERVSVEKVIVVTALGALTLSHTTR